MPTYPLAMPDTRFASIQLRMESVTAMSESPFTFSQQVVEHQGQRWAADISLPPMKRTTAQQWIAWFGLLRGRSKTFTMGDPLGVTPTGSASVLGASLVLDAGTGAYYLNEATSGEAVVDGAGQTGSSLNIATGEASITGWLKAGDYFQLGSGSTTRLFIATEDVNTAADGSATVSTWPDVRSATTDGEAVTISSPKGLWRLNDSVARWSVDRASIYGISFTAVEAVTA